MEKLADFLNRNARNWVYLRHNLTKGRKIADSKWKTKLLLKKQGVPVPEMIKVLRSDQEVVNFAWEKLEGNFVIKPALGYGGEGIIVVKKRGRMAGEWQPGRRGKIRNSENSVH